MAVTARLRRRTLLAMHSRATVSIKVSSRFLLTLVGGIVCTNTSVNAPGTFAAFPEAQGAAHGSAALLHRRANVPRYGLDEHRASLTGHCYRMMGSAADADDAVQETMVRAWRGLGGFEERASLRTWLTRIATRVCLDALADRTRRLRPIELEGPGPVDDPLTRLPPGRWAEPLPDAVPRPAGGAPRAHGCAALDAALPAQAPRTREHQQVDARTGDPVPRLTAGADLGFGLARFRPVSADRTLGAHRARAARRPHRRHELLPGHGDAVPALQAPGRAARLTARFPSASRATDDFRPRGPSIGQNPRRRYTVSTTPSR